MSTNTNGRSGGISVLGLLGVVFVTLKLCGVIDWSWWWVTAPFWGGFALFVVFVGLFFAGGIIYYTIVDNINKRR